MKLNSKELKQKLEDIIKASETINPQKVAEEVITWLNQNVENYVDNATTFFKIDLVLNTAEGMLETQKLQGLYRSIPDDANINAKDIDNVVECRKNLDIITAKCFNEMRASKDLLQALFNRLIFFYEKIIPNPANKKRALEIDEKLKDLILKKEGGKNKDKVQKQIIELIKEGEKLVKYDKLDGLVNVVKFEYDPFELDVIITDKKNNDIDEENDNDLSMHDLRDNEKVIRNQYTIEEGFTCWIELSYKQKTRPTAMF